MATMNDSGTDENDAAGNATDGDGVVTEPKTAENAGDDSAADQPTFTQADIDRIGATIDGCLPKSRPVGDLNRPAGFSHLWGRYIGFNFGRQLHGTSVGKARAARQVVLCRIFPTQAKGEFLSIGHRLHIDV